MKIILAHIFGSHFNFKAALVTLVIWVKCPEWGSNPHWEDFKSSASAIGLSGPRARGKSTLLFLLLYPAKERAIPSKISDSDATNSLAPVAFMMCERTNAPAGITSTRPGCI